MTGLPGGTLRLAGVAQTGLFASFVADEVGVDDVARVRVFGADARDALPPAATDVTGTASAMNRDRLDD